MADVKWIKIMTDIFDDEKILMIESLPSADSLIVIWFKLLCFAGKMNNDGVFLMNNRIAYTDEMLSSIFRRDLQTVRMAMKVFEQYGMVEIINNVITIPNWNKHQTLDAYEKKKERDRLYQMERRKKQKMLIAESSEKSSDSKATTSSYVAISDKDKEKEIDKEIDIIYTSSKEEDSTSAVLEDVTATKKPKKDKPVKHKHGEYNNVLLTDEELDKLKTKFPDWENRIERLSEYMASTGKAYKSHYVTILSWSRREQNNVVTKTAKRNERSYHIAKNEDDPLEGLF